MKYRSIFVCAVSMMVAAGVALAAEQAAAPAAPAAKAAPAAPAKAKKPSVKKSTIMGTVEAVDAAANKLSIKDKKGAVKEVAVAADAKIRRANKAATLAELVVGDKVLVKVEETDGVVTAKKVDAKPAKIAAPAKK